MTGEEKKLTGWSKIVFEIVKPFLFLYSLLVFKRLQLYYITGTGVTKLGDRIYWRTVLTTQKDMIPIKSLETKMKEELGMKMAVVLHWKPISRKLAHYIEKDYEFTIN